MTKPSCCYTYKLSHCSYSLLQIDWLSIASCVSKPYSCVAFTYAFTTTTFSPTVYMEFPLYYQSIWLIYLLFKKAPSSLFFFVTGIDT